LGRLRGTVRRPVYLTLNEIHVDEDGEVNTYSTQVHDVRNKPHRFLNAWHLVISLSVIDRGQISMRRREVYWRFEKA
jgi:hypothetical protein